MNNSIRTVLDEIFSGRKVSEITETPESGHPGNQIVQIQFTDGDQIFLKVRVDGDAERNEREIATTQYARSHCEVRVPSVVAADSMFNPPYLATEPLEGTPLIEDWEADSQREAVAGVSAVQWQESLPHSWNITGG